MALDWMQVALSGWPLIDHRVTIQHGRMSTRAQFLRMRALGLCTQPLLGRHPLRSDSRSRARTERMNACASALKPAFRWRPIWTRR